VGFGSNAPASASFWGWFVLKLGIFAAFLYWFMVSHSGVCELIRFCAFLIGGFLRGFLLISVVRYSVKMLLVVSSVPGAVVVGFLSFCTLVGGPHGRI